jgi:hypothetical protein
MRVDDLQRCPNCMQDLSNLPPPNRCPSCGFEYDRNTRVWRSTETWGRLAVVYGVVGLILGLAVALSYRVFFGHVPNPALPLVLAVLAPALGLAVRRMVSGRLTGRFVALTPRGVVVGTRNPPVLVEWHDLARVVEERGVLKLRRDDATQLVPLDDIFSSEGEAAEFRTAAEEAARRVRGGGAQG